MAIGLRPNTESASSVSLIAGMLVSTTAASSVVSSVASLDITGFCCIDTSVADTASASRSANRRFNSLTEILAVVLEAMRFG